MMPALRPEFEDLFPERIGLYEFSVGCILRIIRAKNEEIEALKDSHERAFNRALSRHEAEIERRDAEHERVIAWHFTIIYILFFYAFPNILWMLIH